MEKYEESTDKDKCDKGIAWIKSCRECLFQVLCKFNSFYQKNGKTTDKDNGMLTNILRGSWRDSSE